MLRPGNAGSNTIDDHVAVLTAAIAQVPAAHRKKLLIRAEWCRCLARAAGLADRAEHETWPERGVLGRVRRDRQGPCRDRTGPRGRVGARDRP